MAGEPSHFEVGVPDAARAKAFFGELFDWSFTTTTGDNAWVETRGVRGGLHDGDEDRSVVVYFRVDDIAAAVRQCGSSAAKQMTQTQPSPAAVSFPAGTTRDSSSAFTSPPSAA